MSSNALVLSASNLDETITGHFTKYDCSSGDLNPIGSIHKSQVRSMVNYFWETHGTDKFGILREYDLHLIVSILCATPCAELDSQFKSDEVALRYLSYQDELQMTYDKIEHMSKLRKEKNYGLSSLSKVSEFSVIFRIRHNL